MKRLMSLLACLAVAFAAADAVARDRDKDKDDDRNDRDRKSSKRDGDRDDKQQEKTELVRFQSLRDSTPMTVVVSPVKGSSRLTLIVPPQDPKAKKYEPDTFMAQTVKDLKKDDLIQITVVRQSGQTVLKALDRYDLKPGEDDPSGYVFGESEVTEKNGLTTIKVVLEKLGEKTTLTVPMAVEGGKRVPDPAIKEALDRLSAGDSVDATFLPSRVLTYIGPYAAPVFGTYVKSELIESGDNKLLAVVVKDEAGSETTYIVPHRMMGKRAVPDAIIAAQVRAMHANDYVRIKTRGEYEGHTALGRIEKTPKPKE